MSEELTATKGNLPAVRTNGSNDLTAADVAFPRVFLGQALSPAVQDQAARVGDLYLANDGTDLDVNVIAGPDEGVTIYLLAKPTKYLERRDDAPGGFGRWAIDNPDAPAPGRETGVYTVYEYAVAIPGAEDDLPVRLTLKRSGVPAARKLNTALLRAGNSTPPYELAFELSSKESFNAESSSKYRSYTVKATEGTAEGREVAKALYDVIANTAQPVVEESGTAADAEAEVDF